MSSNMLKILALLFMLIDHIGDFIPGLPVYLHWIGRLSAPIFIFCSAWGFTYTSNKKSYLIRLYVASLVMAIIQYWLVIPNNFFRTLFSICIIILLIDSYRNKDEQFKKYLCIFLTWQIISVAICIVLIDIVFPSSLFVLYFISALFGNVFSLEGGLVYVCGYFGVAEPPIRSVLSRSLAETMAQLQRIDGSRGAYYSVSRN